MNFTSHSTENRKINASRLFSFFACRELSFVGARSNRPASLFITAGLQLIWPAPARLACLSPLIAEAEVIGMIHIVDILDRTGIVVK